MTRVELQEEFDMIEGCTEQTWFIDQNLEHASDVALANELARRGFQVRL